MQFTLGKINIFKVQIWLLNIEVDLHTWHIHCVVHHGEDKCTEASSHELPHGMNICEPVISGWCVNCGCTISQLWGFRQGHNMFNREALVSHAICEVRIQMSNWNSHQYDYCRLGNLMTWKFQLWFRYFGVARHPNPLWKVILLDNQQIT